MLMDHLTEDTIRTIERLHSAWIEYELAGNAHGLLACCAEDIELRPPDGLSVYGRDAVLAVSGGTCPNSLDRDIRPSPLRIKRACVSHRDL